MLVDSRKMGWLGVVTQEMGIEKVDRPRVPVWTVAICSADPSCILVLPAPCHVANVCCIPQALLPAGFLLGSDPGPAG